MLVICFQAIEDDSLKNKQELTCDLHNKWLESFFTGDVHQLAQPLSCLLTQLSRGCLHTPSCPYDYLTVKIMKSTMKH